MTLAIAALVVTRETFFAPDDGARAYFSALNERDAQALLEAMSAPERLSNVALFQPDALEHSDYEPPQLIEVEEMEHEGDDALVSVTYRLPDEDQERSAVLHVHREGSAWQPFRRWLVTDGTYDLTVSSYAERVLVAGVGVPIGDDGQAHATAPLGAYRVSTPPDSPLYEVATATAVAVDESPPVELGPRIRQAAINEVERQIDALLAECEQSITVTAERCPYFGFSTNDASRFSSIGWEILTRPQYSYGLSSDGRTLTVYTSEYGEARVTGLEEYFGTLYDMDETQSFDVDGWVEVKGKEITYHAGSYGD